MVRQEETMGKDAHLVWRHLTRQPGGAVLALATDGKTVLAGTASGAFLARYDADSWETLAFPHTWGRLELANPVAIAPWGDRYIATPSGLFRQQPNGTWQRCLEGGTIVAIRAATEGTRRLVIVADQLDGILVSSNAGTDWEPANAGLPQLVEVVDLVVSPQFERDRTALLVASDGAFLSRSRRWSWHEIESAPTSLECGALTTDEAGRLSLFLGGDAGLFRSRDRGRTWERLALPVEGSCSLLATDPTGRHLAAAIDRSIVRTADQGENWDCLPALPSHVLSLAVLDREHLVAGTLAHGCLVWDDRAGTWQERNQGLYGRLPVGIIARRSHELLVADYSGTVLHSPDGGSTWQRALLDRGIAQFAGGPTGPVFALALDTLLRSSDGHEWEPVRDIEELSESAWLLASDDGGTVCLVQYTLEPTLEPLVSLAFSRDSGATWQEHRTRAFALVQGAALLTVERSPCWRCEPETSSPPSRSRFYPPSSGSRTAGRRHCRKRAWFACSGQPLAKRSSLSSIPTSGWYGTRSSAHASRGSAASTLRHRHSGERAARAGSSPAARACGIARAAAPSGHSYRTGRSRQSSH